MTSFINIKSGDVPTEILL